MEDRRQHPRHAPALTMELLDLHSGARLGRIVDLSAEGFMLFSDTPMAVDSVWACRLVLETPVNGVHEIQLGADCLWSRSGTNGQHGWGGFHIIDLAEDQAKTLALVLESLHAS
ncbi:PilZ domain-containing protein [Pseudomonas sp. LRF_L74]|uniref:PilZ domain-containing protein n=1 Tax=Pseudomonas sp. LRF_L74 TaxID=3369422 RepID=UPI003F63EE25